MLAVPERSLRFVAKRELARGVPLVSPLLRYGRHALISRSGGLAETREALRRLAALAGVCPVLFPEGTRSRDGSLGPFYSAGVRILCEHASLPLLSVAVDGGAALRDLSRLRRSVRRPVYRVAFLAVHPPPSGKTEVLATLEAVRTEISRQLEIWRGRPR
jgi:1-acyl-sn-glycerol-3-phosphate acyltransferase